MMKGDMIEEEMMEDDEAALDLQDTMEEQFHVNSSPLKEFMPATSKFEEVIANAMMFKQNPEAETLTADEYENDEMLKSVNYVIDKIEQPLDDVKGSGSLAAKLSTKITNSDKVMKCSSTKHSTQALSSTAMEALESMMPQIKENRTLVPDVAPSFPVDPKPYVHLGILLRNIDEEYELDGDDNEILR
ncbi:uncharacterized protein PAC_06969 [Phialocephala subalpina]|uniref:Uncharacterized protein n=1 Tax=Phialocephala subalpina TaxID=576137 RepID=A0A1L7WWD6_9HELO|nr:uncharacterized protein PAC_06969 [Phialocephala subalpina]